MKKLLATVVFLAVVAVGANYLIKGGLPFMQQMSEEDQEVAALRSDLRAAQQEFRQAGRAAGLSGMDTTAEAEAAIREVERIERELRQLERRLTTDTAKRSARQLADEITDFKQEVGL